MKLSRNKLHKILKKRFETKKKYRKKKKQKGKIKRSFRENKLNLKKNTLRYHSQKGGTTNDETKEEKQKEKEEKTSKNILTMARYSCNSKKDGTNIIQKILYIQLLILNWRKLYLSGANCYIVPYSRQDNSGYMKLFGQYAEDGFKEPLKKLKTDEQKAVLNSSFSCQYPLPELKKVFWSPLHNMACQILGYFVIPDWCFAKHGEKEEEILRDGKKKKKRTPKQQRNDFKLRMKRIRHSLKRATEKRRKVLEARMKEIQQNFFLEQFKIGLEKEDIIIFGPNQIVPGKSHLVGAKNYWNKEEELESWKEICKYIITPDSDTTVSTSLWMQNTWGYKYGGSIDIDCNLQWAKSNNCEPSQSRLANISQKKENMTERKMEIWGQIMTANAISQVACLNNAPNEQYEGLSEPAKEKMKDEVSKIKEELKKLKEEMITKYKDEMEEMGGLFFFTTKSEGGKNARDQMISRGLQTAKVASMKINTIFNTCTTSKGGNIMSLPYVALTNMYLLAPTDKMLNYWWQKETLLFVPLLEGSNEEAKSDGNIPIPKNWKDAGEKNLTQTLPIKVKQLILRRVNGIMIRTNINEASRTKEERKIKKEDKEAFQKEYKNRMKKSAEIKTRLMQECQTNYIRAQISKKILLKKFNACRSMSILLAKEKHAETLIANRERERFNRVFEEKSESSIEDTISEILQTRQDQLAFNTRFESVRRNTFLLETRGQDAAKQYVYDPIKMGDWVKLQILSAHQLMLECWSMPLDAKQEGENTILYGIKSALLRNSKNKKQDKNTFKIGDTVEYLEKVKRIDVINGKRKIKYQRCKIIQVDDVENTSEKRYDIQFEESTALQPNLDYIPKSSPLWIKFKLLLLYMSGLSSFLRDEYKPLFAEHESDTTTDEKPLSKKEGDKEEEANLLQLFNKYKALSNGKNKSLNLTEMRVRLCKLWLLFSAVTGWCNYKDLFGVDELKKFKVENDRVILVRKKRPPSGAECIRERIAKGAKCKISCGWAKLIIAQSSEDGQDLKLNWLGQWMEKSARKNTKDAVCKRAPLSGGDCYDDQKRPERLEYWPRPQTIERTTTIRGPGAPITRANENTNLSNIDQEEEEKKVVIDPMDPMDYSGGGKCDIRDLLLRVKIPAGDNMDYSLTKVNLNMKKIATKYTEKAMNEFAKNFKITEYMLKSKQCGGENPLRINCRPIAAPYKNEEIIKWIEDNRNRRSAEECKEEQKESSGPKIWADGRPDSLEEGAKKKVAAAAKVVGTVATNAATAAKKAAKGFAEGLREQTGNPNSALRQGVSNAASKVGTAAKFAHRQITDPNSGLRKGLSNLRKTMKRYKKKRRRKTRRLLDGHRYQGDDCDDECQKRMAQQQFISILIQPTPGIKPGYTVSLIQEPSGPLAAQAVAMLARSAARQSNTTGTGQENQPPTVPTVPAIPIDPDTPIDAQIAIATPIGAPPIGELVPAFE